eukprot:TRINITY_DN23137_c0_g1_i1.p1 TRINITY_DN23137_c0_g1~~TRINITY_DN23137_c0_g1_i1.p1  ORF type:complete len:246 (+),score=33.64 TRINITY_DN23137_c0_g1_i1:209-946(+)
MGLLAVVTSPSAVCCISTAPFRPEDASCVSGLMPMRNVAASSDCCISWSRSRGWGAKQLLYVRLHAQLQARAGSRQRVVRMSLPSALPSLASETDIKLRPRWSARAIKSFSMGELEARKLHYPTTGTEALLMGMLTEGTSAAARFLRANGVTLFGVREETLKLLGKADAFYFSPEHPPLTEPAQKALDWAVENSNAGPDSELTTEHMLLGIWNQTGSAGQQILASMGFDDSKAAQVEGMIGGGRS